MDLVVSGLALHLLLKVSRAEAVPDAGYFDDHVEVQP